MIKNVFNYCMISSVIIGTVFIIALLFSKYSHKKPIRFLSLVVLFFVLNNLQIVLIDNVFLEANYFIRNLLIPFYVLITPAFYAFMCYYLKVEKTIKNYLWITLMLFLIEIVFRIVFYFYYYNDNKNIIVATYSQIEEIINAMFSVFLFVKAFLLLFENSKLFQTILSFDNLKWLKTFMFLGSLILVTWIVAILLNLDKVINPQIFIYYPLRLSSSILLFWLGYQGFFNYSMLLERIELRNTIVEANKTKFQAKGKGTIQNDKFILVKEYVESNARFLDPIISLETLANELKMSTSSLSQMINNHSGYNFSDYINFLRVEQAKSLLNNDGYSQYTIFSIGLECGFNSKSTFYSAFKKFTNTTPSEFRCKKT